LSICTNGQSPAKTNPKKRKGIWYNREAFGNLMAETTVFSLLFSQAYPKTTGWVTRNKQHPAVVKPMASNTQLACSTED
jgi:hypothetical protein